jgi:hypothetical protein
MLTLLVHLLVLCLVGAILYWVIMLVVGILPPPIAPIARVILLVLLALIAIGVLLGDVGVVDTNWGWYRHRW